MNMGTSCITDVVPFVSHGRIYNTGCYSSTENDHDKICAPEAYLGCEFDWQDPNKSYPVLIVNGWTYDPGTKGFDYYGRHKRLYTQKWVKGDLVCYTINEAQWANGGENDIAVLSDTASAITEFCKDNNLLDNFNIDDDDAVRQFL
jgi:hypothetical protein